MRKAVIALGLFIFIPMLYQSFISTLLGRRVGSLRLFGGGVVGIVIALLWLPAMILVNFFPLGSVVLFGVAGCLGIGAGIIADVPGFAAWGALSWLLAAMSGFGWREQRTADRRAWERRAQMANPAITRLTGDAPLLGEIDPLEAAARCAFCGAMMMAAMRYCAECGAARVRSSATGESVLSAPSSNQ